MNRVAIDIDEVLVNFLFPMAKYHMKTIHKPKYNYVYRQIFDIDEKTSQKMVQEFYRSKAFMELTPIRGSQRAMFNLKKKSKKMYIVTLNTWIKISNFIPKFVIEYECKLKQIKRGKKWSQFEWKRKYKICCIYFQFANSFVKFAVFSFAILSCCQEVYWQVVL